MLHLPAHLPGHAVFPVIRQSGLHQRAQPFTGRRVFPCQLVGVLVAQLREREAAARRHPDPLLQQGPREQPRELAAGTQVALAVTGQGRAELGQRTAEADRGERVLEGSPATAMHQHPAAGESRYPGGRGQPGADTQPFGVRAVAQGPHAEPAPAGEASGKPRRRLLRQRRGHPQDGEAVRQRPGQLRAPQAVGPLRGQAPRQADERAQLAVGTAVGGEHHQRGAVLEHELAADDQRQPRLPGGHVRPHHAGDGALVGHRQGRVPQLGGARHQLAGMGGPAAEAEVAQAVELGVGGGLVVHHGVSRIAVYIYSIPMNARYSTGLASRRRYCIFIQ